MEFSYMLLQYIQKHYSPISTRIVHILIIFSISVSLSIVLISIVDVDNFQILVAIVELIIMVIVILVVALGQQNNAVEKMERAIFLNTYVINKFDEENKKKSFEKIDAVFSFMAKFKTKGNYKQRVKKCLEFLDEENKSNYKKTKKK